MPNWVAAMLRITRALPRACSSGAAVARGSEPIRGGRPAADATAR